MWNSIPKLDNESRKVTVDTQPTALETSTYRKTSENKPVARRPPRRGAERSPQQHAARHRDHRAPGIHARREPRRTGGRRGPRTDDAQESVAHSRPPSPPPCWCPRATSPSCGSSRIRRPPAKSPRRPLRAGLKTIEQEVTDTITKTVGRTLPPSAAGETAASRVEVGQLRRPAATADRAADDGRHRRSLVRGQLAQPGPGRRRLGELADAAQHGALRCPGDPRGRRRRSACRPRPSKSRRKQAPEPEPIILNRRTPSTGAILRDELTAMVREDPDAAANVLRNWIGDAA